MSKQMIEVEALEKTFGSGDDAVRAVRGVDFAVDEGQIFGLLGANGAGKSTCVLMLATLLSPTAGNARVNGFDVLKQPNQVRQSFGAALQETGLDPLQKAGELLVLHGRLYGYDKAAAEARATELLEVVGLVEDRDRRIGTYSGGMKRRLMIAKALSHEPQILFLDEPTAGVDVSLRKDMWELVRGLQNAGTTIILTTHYIEEAEEMADRIGIIRRGELMLVEDKESLMKKLGKKELTLQLLHPLESIPERLKLPGLTLSTDHLELVYSFDTHSEQLGIAGFLQRLSDLGIAFKDLNTTQSSLEDIFVGLVNSGSTAS